MGQIRGNGHAKLVRYFNVAHLKRIHMVQITVIVVYIFKCFHMYEQQYFKQKSKAYRNIHILLIETSEIYMKKQNKTL